MPQQISDFSAEIFTEKMKFFQSQKSNFQFYILLPLFKITRQGRRL